MNKPVTVDRHELHDRVRALRYEFVESAIEVLRMKPETDQLIESVLDSFKRIEALLVRR